MGVHEVCQELFWRCTGDVQVVYNVHGAYMR